MLYYTLAFQQLRFFVWGCLWLLDCPISTQRVIRLYSETHGGHSHDVSKIEPQLSTRGQIAPSNFYIFNLNNFLLLSGHSFVLFSYQVYCISILEKMVHNAKFIVKGSSRAKIYSVFKYVNFGSLTAPEAFIVLFVNGIPLQRVIQKRPQTQYQHIWMLLGVQ